ncbi:MAG TPA: polysaccharide biosynthesis protein [Candidatus Pygmaiobacter gallistercoris]|nr:polysaccharide biosynthesis protein [Candidatus Pygmaiobacter gallistercoris]
MKKKLFLKNAVILTATGLLLRAVGMLFRIYIAGRIGDEGMGLYQLIFTVYNLAITLASSGASVAVTRMTADWLAKGNGSPRALCRRLLLYACGTGCAAGALQLLLARPVSRIWLGDERAALSLRLLAPSLPAIAVGAALRGYFMARRNVASASRAQLFEQAVRIAVVALLVDRALPLGVEYGCAAVVLGNTVSELLSCLWMLLSWRRDLRRFPKAQEKEKVPAGYAAIVAPITATRGISSLLVTVENVLVPGQLALFCGSRSAALAQFGQLKGMAMPVLFFPFSFLATLSTLLLPEIAEAHSAGRKDQLRGLVTRTIRITAVLSVLAGGLFAAFSSELGQLLYHSQEIGFYIGVLGPLMPFLYLESMVDGILKGVGQQTATFRYSVLDSGLRILLVLALVPRFGMKGFLFMMLFSNLFTSLLNLRRLLWYADLRIDWGGWVLKPVFSVFAGWTACRFLFLPAARALPLPVQIGCGAAIMAGVYLLFLWLCGGIRREDLRFAAKQKS